MSTITELLSELQAQNATKLDLVAPTQKITLWGADPAAQSRMLIDLNEGVGEYGIRDHAHRQIADALDIPGRFYDSLRGRHPDLHRDLANGLLTREPKKRMIRTVGGDVRAFLSDRYQRRDNWDLLEHLTPILASYPDVHFKKCDLTETRMYVKVFLPGLERQITPKVGDVVRGGVIISNSEVGAGALMIAPYTDRLICLNGMVHTDFGKRAVHLGGRISVEEEAFELYSDETKRIDDAAFFAKCADVLRACLNEVVFDSIVQQMRDLTDVRMPGSPVEQVKVLGKTQGFTEDEQASILTHLIEGGDLSGWGWINSLTATARDLPDTDRQTEIEVLAGRLTSNPADLVKAVGA